MDPLLLNTLSDMRDEIAAIQRHLDVLSANVTLLHHQLQLIGQRTAALEGTITPTPPPEGAP